MGGFLRQSATVVFGPTLSPSNISAVITMPMGLLGTANTRLVGCQVISGPGEAANQLFAPNGTQFPIDIGPADSVNQFSTDILIWNEIASDAGKTQLTAQVGNGSASDGSYCAVWVGEYTEIDQTNYGYQGNPKDSNGNVDYDASTGANGSGSTVNCTRGGGQSVNYTPELSIWCAGGTTPVTVTGQTYTAEGFVTDGAHIWLAVQDSYFDATGLYNPTFTLSASSYWNWANLTMKTLAMPPSGPPVGGLSLLGVGR